MTTDRLTLESKRLSEKYNIEERQARYIVYHLQDFSTYTGLKFFTMLSAMEEVIKDQKKERWTSPIKDEIK